MEEFKVPGSNVFSAEGSTKAEALKNLNMNKNLNGRQLTEDEVDIETTSTGFKAKINLNILPPLERPDVQEKEANLP